MTLVDTTRAARRFRPAFLLRLAAQCRAAVTELRDRRAIARSMARLSPRDLRDIGLTAKDVTGACSGSLSVDAAADLKATARRRSRNW